MSQMPSKAEILEWISDNPTLTAKRDIAKAFGIKGAARIDLKRLLKELEDEGHLEKRKKTYRDPDRLPPVSVLQINALTPDGELLAKPLEWQGEGVEPVVLLIPRASDPALGEGDRILARLQEVKAEAHHYEARLIRRIGTNPRKVLGVSARAKRAAGLCPSTRATARNGRSPATPPAARRTASWSRPNRPAPRPASACPAPGCWSGWATRRPRRRCRSSPFISTASRTNFPTT